MFGRLLLLFLLMPVVELWLLFQVGERIGLVPTLAIILVTGVAGSWLAKREGLATWQRLQEKLRSGGLPGTELVDGVIILVAGALLITPGVLTDFVGFAGLIPPSRVLIRKYAFKRFERSRAERTASFQAFTFGGPEFGGPGFGSGGDFGGGTGGSEGQRDAETTWRGQGRQVPGYAEESGDARPRGE
jgi:UPF0716 protein FxsA